MRSAIYDGRGCAAPRPSYHDLARRDNLMRQARIDLPDGLPIQININWFHIIDGDGAGAVAAHTTQAQVSVLNAAYAPAGIQFRSAEVIELESASWYRLTFGSAEERLARRLARYPGRLVIMTVGMEKSMAAAIGWASFPWQKAGDPDLDGVTLYHGVLPGGAHRQNLGMTAVHEVGHWLGLRHTFEGGCDRTGDDVDDTPPQARPNTGQPVRWIGCGDSPGPVANYMDYCDDAAMHHFTAGQCDRMRRTLAVYRPELRQWTG